MREQIENVLSKVADTARNGVNSAVDVTQDRVSQAGKVVANGKKPVQKVSRASLDANAVAFRMSKELIELQSKSVQTGIDAVAKRLRDASRADSVRELLAQQRDVLPGTARHYVSDAKAAFGIVRGAVSEFGSVVGGLRTTSVAKKAKTVAKKATKKVARKKPVKRAKAKTAKVAKKVATTVNEAAQKAQSA
ncbi:MAG: phasin family protein [Pseudomonadota bacterium]